MAIIDINRNPTKRELLWFGGLLALFFAVVGTIASFKFSSTTLASALWIVGLLLSSLHFLVPAIRQPLYLGWMYAVYPIGWTISHVILAIVYYGVLTPIGLVFRLAGRDFLERGFQPEAHTYWKEHDPGKDRARYFRQF